MAALVGTGHRQQSLLGGFKNKILHQKIKLNIKNVIEDIIGPDLIYTGMAIGFDQWLAEAAIELNIPFVACLPFEGQENRWPQQIQQHYNSLLNKADKIVMVDREIGYISEQVPPGVYHPYKMLKRNEYMIDQMAQGDYLLSLWNGKRKSGTFHCINYFNRSNGKKRHFNINPTDPKLPCIRVNRNDDLPF